MLSGLSLSKENVTIRSGYESILRFYGYDLGDGSSEEGNVGLITTTQSNRREQDEPENSTPMQTTNILTTNPPIFMTTTAIPDRTTVKMEPPTTQLAEEKVTESKVETTTSTPTETPTELPEIITETTMRVTENTSREPVKITSTAKTTFPTTTIFSTTYPTTTVPMTIPTTVPTQPPYLSETTTQFFETTRVPTSRYTYPTTEETTILPVTEAITSTMKPSHLFTFKPITTTPSPEAIGKRFYNLPPTIPSLPAIRSTDPTNQKLLNSLTTIPLPTSVRLNPSDFANARLNPRNSRTSRVKKEAISYNSFIPLAPNGYGVPSDVNFYDPYFDYATPNPPDLYYPEGNPIFATKEFGYDDPHHDEVDHIFYLNPHDSIRIGFKVYNTILRFAYIASIQASALELPLDSENYSLLILVPDQPIEDMVDVLGSHLSPSLTNIRAALRENWIKTMIPKFQLKGNVVLTGDLMKVYIW